MKHQKALSQFLIVLIVLSFLFSFYHLSFVFATTIFSDGFESGDLSAWDANNGEISVSTTQKHCDTYSARVLLSAGTTGWVRQDFTASSDVYLRAYVYIDSAASDTAHQYLRVGSGSGEVSFGAYTADGTSWVLYIDGDGLWDMWGSITTDEWHCLELRRKAGAGTGIVQAWVDETQVVDETGLTVNGDSTIAYTGIIYSNRASGLAYVDCAVIADAYIGPEVSTFFPYIQQISDVDSMPDVGTHGNFSAQQYAPASNYDLLTEADTDTGTSNLGDTSGTGTSYRTTAANEMRLFSIQAVNTGQVDSITFYGRGNAAAQNCKGIVTDSSGNLLTNGVGDVVSVSTTAGSKTLKFTNKPLITAGQTYWFGVVTAGAVRIYYDATTGGTDKRDTTNSYTTPTSPTDATDTTETWRIFYASITELNYQLQLEEQFTDVPTNYGTNYLCVNTGGLSAENLNAQIWNGSWQTLGALSASQWNNYTINSYMGNSSIYIRFLSAAESDDNIQSTWNISSVYLWAYNSTNYSYSYSAVGVYSVSGSSRDYREFASLLSAAASVTSSGSNSYLKELALRFSSTLLLSGFTSFNDELSYALKYTASLNGASTLQNELAYLSGWASSIAGQSLSSKELLDSLLNYISINGQSGLANELLISLASSVTFSSLTNMSAQTQISNAYSFLIRDYLAVYGTTNLNLELQYVQNWVVSLSDKNLSLKELASSLQAYISTNPSSYNLLAKELQYVISALSLFQHTDNVSLELQIVLLKETLSITGLSNLGLEVQYVSGWISSVADKNLSLKDLATSLQIYIIANPSNSSLLAKELQYVLSVLSLTQGINNMPIEIQVLILRQSLSIVDSSKLGLELQYISGWASSVSGSNLSMKELANSLQAYILANPSNSSLLAKELQYTFSVLSLIRDGTTLQIAIYVAVNGVYGLNGSIPISGDVRFSKELAYLEPWLLSVSDKNLSAKELATSLSVYMIFAGSSSLAKELLLQLNSMITVSSGALAQFGVVLHDFFYSIADSLGLTDSLEAFANSLNSLFPPRTETVGGFVLVDVIAAVLIGVILAVVVCISLFIFNRRQGDDD